MPSLLFLDHQIGLKPGDYVLESTPYTAIIPQDLSHALEILRTRTPDLLVVNPATVGAGQLLAVQEANNSGSRIPAILYSTDTGCDHQSLSFLVQATVDRKEGLDSLIRVADRLLHLPGSPPVRPNVSPSRVAPRDRCRWEKLASVIVDMGAGRQAGEQTAFQLRLNPPVRPFEDRHPLGDKIVCR